MYNPPKKSWLARLIAPKAAPEQGTDVVVSRRKAWTIGGGGGLYRILESFTGAWQKNIELNADTAATNWAVFSCATLIANDIAKLPANVMLFNKGTQIWEKQAGLGALDQPNSFQLWPDFMRVWMYSLLLRGNTYTLLVKNRDTGFVDAMYILDPNSVRPLVTPSGDVYYSIGQDALSHVSESLVVPAYMIMHDRINALFHPLVGLSPLWASGLAAIQGIEIQKNSAQFFKNASKPGGILSAPGEISDDTADRLAEYWNDNFIGDSTGKIAVVGDDLKFQQLTTSAEDAQLIEQLKFTGEMICATFHVPPYKLGLGTMPTVGTQASQDQAYFDQCLQPYVDSIERRLDVGFNMIYPRQIWIDTDELLRMDKAARTEVYKEQVSAGMLAPNEARRTENMPPVPGGESPYLQQQNYSLAALAKRDASDDPFKVASNAPNAPNATTQAPPPPDDTSKSALSEEDIEMCTTWFAKQLEVTHAS